MVVVNGQSALFPTTTSVSLASPTDGTLAILSLEESLILFNAAALTTSLVFTIRLREAVTAMVFAICESRELFPGLLSSTPLANGFAILHMFMPDLMETAPDQVASNDAKAQPRFPRHFAERQTASEKFRDLVHWHYLKRKQQRSLVAN